MSWLGRLLRRIPVWKRKFLKLKNSEAVRLIVAIATLILKHKKGDDNG